MAIWFDGTIQFSTAYGVSNAETGETLTTAHLFRIASHSKTFTATAMMQLVEAGTLRLDDTAGSWIPDLAKAGSPLADATGFYSTADDMVRFASAHFFGDDRLISD